MLYPVGSKTYVYNDKKTLHVYSPPSTSGPVRGCILYVHGGAWVSANNLNAREVAINLANCGYVVVTPNYTLTESSIMSYLPRLLGVLVGAPIVCDLLGRTTCSLIVVLVSLCIVVVWGAMMTRAPRYQHPVHINDVRDSYAWTLDNIPESRVKFFIGGHSAGAHLAGLLSALIDDSTISGVFLISGVYIHRYMKHPIMKMLNREVFAYQSTAFPDHPMYDSGTPPRHLIINAGKDMGLLKHAKAYTKMLRERGGDARGVLFRGTTHFSIRRQWDSINSGVLQTLLAFFNDEPIANDRCGKRAMFF